MSSASLGGKNLIPDRIDRGEISVCKESWFLESDSSSSSFYRTV